MKTLRHKTRNTLRREESLPSDNLLTVPKRINYSDLRKNGKNYSRIRSFVSFHNSSNLTDVEKRL